MAGRNHVAAKSAQHRGAEAILEGKQVQWQGDGACEGNRNI